MHYITSPHHHFVSSIFNCNSELLIHAYFEALWSHIFCSFVVLTLYVSLYFRPLRAVGTKWAHADASCSPQAQPVSNSVTSHTGWTSWLLPLRNTKGRMFFHAQRPAEVGETSWAEVRYMFCRDNTRVGAALANDGSTKKGRRMNEFFINSWQKHHVCGQGVFVIY